MKFILFLSLFSLSFSGYAEDHSLGTLRGTTQQTPVDLKVYDHSFAGSIRDFTVFGWLDESTFTSYLTVRKYAHTFQVTFKKEEGKIGGVLAYDDKEVKVEFKGYDKQKQTLFFDNISNAPKTLEVNWSSTVLTRGFFLISAS